MKLDEMSEQQILDAEARGDEMILDAMSGRLRMLVASIEAAGRPRQMTRLGIPNSPANQLVVKRAAKLFPDVEIGIRIS